MNDEPPPRGNALLALLLVVLLAAGGFWVTRVLHDAGRTEDCLLRGGHNCAPLGR